ncbi:G5 domain-containing protein [Bacillus sp. es.034]|uniref:G5 domain-containing protein n=1 Tax=Bacillus sp. es.034 TaxID=1761763 RepID=UPI000BFAB00D|nr:G5 domain-containing protein [Bacillus sp. es.034]PFG05521.1 surface rod structure-forming protein G [Bacillus sp. es.034]
MGKTFPFTKLSVFFVLCSIYVFGFAHLGAFAYDRLFSPNQAFLEGTKIGNIDVSTLSYPKAEDEINHKIEEWKGNQSMTLSYMDTIIPLNSKLFRFDPAASLQEATQGGEAPLLVSLDGLDSLLSSNEVNTSMLDLEGLGQEIREHAANLDDTDENLPIEDFFIQSDSIEIISEINMEGITSTPGLQNLFDTSEEIELEGSSSFSLLTFLNEEAFTGMSNQELSTFASYLYQLILPTNFEVIERNQGRELPEDIDLGFEAYVNQDQGDDFIFTNPNDAVYKIILNRQGDSFSLALTGAEMPYEIIVDRRNEQTFKPKVIKQYSPYLNKGEVKVKEEGRNGMKIEVWRSFETKNGELLKEERISEDFYLPVFIEEIHSMKDYVVEKPEPTAETNESASGSQNEVVPAGESSDPTDQYGPANPNETEENASPENADGEDVLPSETDLSLSNMK